MIKIKNLCKSFKDSEPVLDDINEEINKGDIIVIVGPSGSGKSTLLRCLNLLEKPTSGEIIFEGKNITKKGYDINKMREKVGMVFQHFNLFPHFDVLKNITFAAVKHKIYTQEKAEKKAEKLLTRVGLLDKKNEHPNMLSGGQKQRLAIIRALILKPHIMLFDEPTSALDPEMVGEVLGLIRELKKDGMTMAIVTHEMNFAKEVATKVWFMDNGKIIEKGSPKTFFKNPKTKRAKEFLVKLKDR